MGDPDYTNVGDTTEFDRFLTVITICENIARLVSKSSTECYLQQVTILTRLEQYWTNKYDVRLSLVSSVYQEDDNDASVPQVVTDEKTSFIDETKILKIETCSTDGYDENIEDLKNYEELDMDCSEEKKIKPRKYSSSRGNSDGNDNGVRRKKKRRREFPAKFSKNSASENENLRRSFRSTKRKSWNIESSDPSAQRELNSDYDSSRVTQAESSQGKKSFVCESCQETFEKLGDLRKHFREQHAGKVYKADSSKFSCKHCDKSFSSAKILRKHVLIHDKCWACHLCGLKFAYKYRLLNHIDSHEIVLDLKCSSCEMRFSSYAALTAHVQHQNKHICTECNIVFPYLGNLSEHMGREHAKDAYARKLPQPKDKVLVAERNSDNPENNIDKSSLEQGLSTSVVDNSTIKSSSDTDKKPMTSSATTNSCAICKVQFSNSVILNKHMRLLHRHYVCQLCSKAFSSKSLLRDHGRTHGISLDLKCSSCDLEFSNYALLVEHTKVHKNNHQCRECDVVFSYRCQLKAHFRKVHSEMINEEKSVVKECSEMMSSVEQNSESLTEPNLDESLSKSNLDLDVSFDYECPHCEKKFSRRSALSKHSKTHNKRLICQVCDKAFAHNYELKDHMDLHEISHVLKCLSCNMEFESNSELTEHALKSHKKDQRCKYCNESFRHLYRLKYHVLKKHPKENLKEDVAESNTETKVILNSLQENDNGDLFRCFKCSKSFPNRKTFDLHMRSHEMRYKCEECNAKFSFKSKLNLHMDTHGVQHDLKCLSCEEKFESYALLSLHTKAHGKEHKCRECGKTFQFRYKLKNHITARHTKIERDLTNRPYLCSTCGASFCDQSTFYTHIKLHSNEKRYRCTVCDRAFFQSGGLREHMFTHGSLKRHMCNICGLTFTRPHLLQCHIRLHTGERPFPCNFCDRRFRIRRELRNHARIHSTELSYSCAVCSEMFKTMNARYRHMTSHSQDFSFCCPICDKRFIADRNLRAHIKSHTKQITGGDVLDHSLSQLKSGEMIQFSTVG